MIIFFGGGGNFLYVNLSERGKALVGVPGEPEHRHQRRREGHEAGSDQRRGQNRGKDTHKHFLIAGTRDEDPEYFSTDPDPT